MVSSDNPFRQSVRVLGLFIRSQLIIAAVETLLYATGFAIAHVPWWPLFALIGGFCSFIPTLGTMILGLIAGRWLRTSAPAVPIRKFVIAGLISAAAALLLHMSGVCPIVKRIWTPSWTLFSGGACFLL